MIDREKVLAVLQKRFPGAPNDQVAAAANAIVGLRDEWIDVTARQPGMESCLSGCRAEDCYIAAQRQQGFEVRILMKPPGR
jgi:hypothetical protein